MTESRKGLGAVHEPWPGRPRSTATASRSSRMPVRSTNRIPHRACRSGGRAPPPGLWSGPGPADRSWSGGDGGGGTSVARVACAVLVRRGRSRPLAARAPACPLLDPECAAPSCARRPGAFRSAGDLRQAWRRYRGVSPAAVRDAPRLYGAPAGFPAVVRHPRWMPRGSAGRAGRQRPSSPSGTPARSSAASHSTRGSWGRRATTYGCGSSSHSPRRLPRRRRPPPALPSREALARHGAARPAEDKEGRHHDH